MASLVDLVLILHSYFDDMLATTIARNSVLKGAGASTPLTLLKHYQISEQMLDATGLGVTLRAIWGNIGS